MFEIVEIPKGIGDRYSKIYLQWSMSAAVEEDIDWRWDSIDKPNNNKYA